jgi:hypothetical protein
MHNSVLVITRPEMEHFVKPLRRGTLGHLFVHVLEQMMIQMSPW